MNGFINTIIRHIFEFFSHKARFRVILIIIIAIIAIAEFLHLGLARRTFVFYTISDREIVVEDRMLKKAPTREIDIIWYTEETLLGPVSPELSPLFPRGTKLKTLLYRNGTVFADFSIEASLPPIEGGSTLDNFRTLREGIFRNFSSVKDVRFFIEGNAVFPDRFAQVSE